MVIDKEDAGLGTRDMGSAARVSRLASRVILAQFDAAHPLARKLLVAPDVNWGRETLFALARKLGGAVGWEVTTLLGLAQELAFTAMGHQGLRRASDVELTVLVDRAITAVCGTGAVSDGFAGLAVGMGFRRAVKDAVLTLRTAGVSSATVQAAVERHTPAWDAASVLAEYQVMLSASKLVDPAGLLLLALEQFDEEAPFVMGDQTILAAELAPTGLGRQLLHRLIESGATTLPVPAPREVPAPARSSAVALDFFVAASPDMEILEVLRRVVAEGHSWDEVEIVATDRDAYGIALDAACQREGMLCTLYDGVPLTRTRVGRTAERWLAWLSDGLPVNLVREALEAGDLPDDASGDSGDLPHFLRTLNIGWGRARYQAACEELAGDRYAARASQRDDEDDAAFAGRLERYRRDSAQLLPLLERLLAVTPPVPEHGSQTEVVASCSRLARALNALMQLLPLRTDADRRTAGRLEDRLTELAAGDDTDTGFGLAMAELRDGLSDLRAWTDASPAEHPRASCGGAIHLTDIAHGGTTGRRRVFVVGLDADRTGGARLQDPILPDSARRLIAAGELLSSAERRDLHRWQLAAMFARVEGKVTVSLALGQSDASEPASPAHVLLELYRQQQGDDTASYKQLHAALGEPCCAVPGEGAALSTRGAWLATIAGGSTDYRDGQSLVREAWPALGAGLRAAAARSGGVLTAWHGLVPAAAGRLDPRASQSPISPTSLESLSSCPLAWFYRYGLGLKPPDDQEYDSEQWLDAMARGLLLHKVYETLARDYAGRQQDLLDNAARLHALGVTNALLAEYRRNIPPPSSSVYETEAAEIRESALAFLEGERQNAREGRTTWARFEMRFGAAPEVRFPLGEGSIPVKGFIDRVDRQQDGQLVVIDYKTGAPGRFEKDKRSGPFHGGRHLQPAIYAEAARQLLVAEVARFEYRFPTVRGENQSVPYQQAELDAATGIIAGLMGHVERGEFIPTTDAHDCAWCDCAPICRAANDDYHNTSSPRAEWAAEHAPALREYTEMIQRRAGA